MNLTNTAIFAHLLNFYNPLELDVQFNDDKLAVVKANGNVTFLHSSSRGLLAVSVQGLIGHFITHPEFYSAVPHNTFMSKRAHPSECIDDLLVDLELVRED